MSSELVASVFFFGMIVCMMIGIPIAICLATIGFLGCIYIAGFSAAASGVMGLVPFTTATAQSMVAIPLFILMGNIALHTNFASDLFNAARLWLGRTPAGLAVAALASCGFFSSITGSSMACSVAMGSIAIPEMRRNGYNAGFASGIAAAGGTLGVLIPPSTIFIIYGALTETSIPKLFLAGIIPGLLLVSLYMAIAMVRVWFNPRLAPRYELKVSWGERFRCLNTTIPMALLFVALMGGMWLGIFTPEEAAGVGTVVVLFLALLHKRLNWRVIVQSLKDTGKTTGMIMAIFVGATIMIRFASLSRLNMFLVELCTNLGVTPLAFIGISLLMYLVLGCIIDPAGMIFLTLPLLIPIIKAVGIDLIWYGVFMVVCTEMAGITPPVGLNCFVIAGVAGDVPLNDIFKNAGIFVIAQLVCIGVLIMVPHIVSIILPVK